MEQAPAPVSSTRQVAFLPWLRLKNAQRAAGVEFLPLRGSGGATHDVLADLADPISAVLAGYVNREGEHIDGCVVATIPGRGWDLSDSDFATVQWAAALLFLASWACNEYFPRWSGPYVNSSSFRVVWQRFSGAPEFVALVSRRRDGRNWDGGYKHGEVKFSLPLQCSLRAAAAIDESFLKALDSGHTANCQTIQRLRYALPFVSLANADDDLMAEAAEAILMGSAFEQLLTGDGSAYKLGHEFGDIFRSSGTVAADEAKKARPGIQVDTSTPERAAAQPRWWVHRKWVEELYDVRSKAVHEGTSSGRTWGWAIHEHLVMAAWVFPLAVKLLLERDGQYTFTDRDKARCLSVDKLLAARNWDEKTEGGSGPPKWHEIVSTTARDYDFNQRMARFFERNPHLLEGGAMENSGAKGNKTGNEPA